MYLSGNGGKELSTSRLGVNQLRSKFLSTVKMPWLDPNANSIGDAAGAGAEDNTSTSVLLVVPGPRTIGGPSDKGQSSFYGDNYV